MKPLALALALAVATVVDGCACAGSSEKPSPASTPSTAAERELAPGEDPTAPVGTPTAAPEPLDPVAADPLAGITGDPKLTFPGEPELLRFAGTKARDAAVGAFDAACLSDVAAADEPARVDAKLENIAQDQGVTLGRLRFVRLETPPGAPAPSPPRLCRPVAPDAALSAPLFRVREPAARWAVRPLADELAPVLHALLTEEAGVPAAVPRVLVVRGAPVGLALPLAP
jgi:hypothetical protein